MSQNGQLSTLDAEARIDELEQAVATLAWLHAELSFAYKLMMAKLTAAQLAPLIEQQLIQRLSGLI